MDENERTNERTNERMDDGTNDGMQVLRHMCEGLVALLMDRPDYHKFMMRSVARDLLASLVFRPIMQHMTPYNVNKVHSSLQAACLLLGSLSSCCIVFV